MAEISKAEMVKRYIIEEVKAGRIIRGQRLPSCREISSLLNINKITVNKAYSLLEEEHKVYSIPRGGFYLVDSENKRTALKKEIDFGNVRLEEKLIPYREFTHVINKAVDLYKNNLFEYGSSMGLPTLRETLKVEFEKDGIYTTSDNIVISNGAQQAISLVLQAVFKKNKSKLLIEVPSYNLAIKLAEQLGINMVGIERTICGYNYKELEKRLKKGDIAAFYIIPRHHNPTGYSLAEKDKQKVAELCNKYNVFIIEDDYLCDLGTKKGTMPIHYYDISKSTIYIRSFSKAFMPGIRLGCAVIPNCMIEEVAEIKKLNDLNTSKLSQAALELFIKSGMYEKHVKKVKKSYEAKMRIAKEMFMSLKPKDIVWNIPQNGIFIWLKLPEYIDINILYEKLKSQGILIKLADEFFLKDKLGKNGGRIDFNYLRLCISGVSKENIDDLSTIISNITNYKD